MVLRKLLSTIVILIHIIYVSSQEGILSERQVTAIAIQVNDDFGLPLVSEEYEHGIIEAFIQKINPHIEPALNVICGKLYTQTLKIALDEKKTLKERRADITSLLRGDLSEPLARNLNEAVNFDLVPEAWEGTLFEIAANKMISEFVDWIVGNIDKKVTESLAGAKYDP